MREDLLTSAVSFLTSPKVQSADKEKKIQFLKKKGLDDEEIEEAFKRAGSTDTTTAAAVQPVVNNNNNNNSNNKPSVPIRPTTVYQLPPKIVYYPPPGPARLTTKQLVGWVVILGLGAFGVTSAVAMVIKQCMKRVLNKIGAYQGGRYRQYDRLASKVKGSLEENTVKKDKGTTTLSLLDNCVQEQKHLTERLDKLTLKLKSSDLSDDRCTELKATLDDFRTAVLRHPTLDMQSTFSNDYYTGSNGGLTSSYANRYRNDNSNNTAIQSIKSEIRSIKGALLSRRNFPTVNLPTLSTSTTPAATTTTTASNTTTTPPPSTNAVTPTTTSSATTTPSTPTTNTNTNTTTTTTTTTSATTNTSTDPSSQPGYHPRNRRSYRSELASTATTVEEVKDDEAK